MLKARKNPNLPQISILIPAFNKEQFIAQAIESGLSQTYPNKEIVVADDCSKDATWLVVRKFEGHPAVRLFQNPKNLGRAANHRHLLYNLASGKYAVMLDADDYFIDENFVADAVKLSVNNNLRLTFAGAQVQNIKTKKIRPAHFPFAKSGIYPFQEIFRQGILFMHGAVLYQRDLALKHNFYSQDIIADDNESFLRLIVGRDQKVGFIKRAVFLYRQDSSAERFSVYNRLQNDLMINSVYQHAVAVCPEEKELFNWWRARMLSTFFYGNLINLASRRKYNEIRLYLLAYLKKYSFLPLLQALKYPRAVWKWGGYQGLIKHFSFAKLRKVPKIKLNTDS